MIALPDSPQRLLHLSTAMLALGTLLLLSGVTLAYGMADQLDIGSQVGAHAVIVIGPAIFKLGYVMRLAAQQRLQRGD